MELLGELPKIVAVAEQTVVAEQIVVEGQTAAEEQTVVVVYPVVGKTVEAVGWQTAGAAVGRTVVGLAVHLAVGEDHQRRQ